MKNKILLASVSLLTVFLIGNTAEAKVIYDTGTPNIMITTPDFVNIKRNTELKWNWTTLKKTESVDLYLISGSKKYTFAKKYPNTGNFSWAAGFASTEWKKEIGNGKYSIAVCAGGQKKIDQSCGIFDLELYGDSPVIKIISPKGGKTFKKDKDLEVVFSGAKIGEKYKILLWYPAKVSPIETFLGEVIADDNGKQSFNTIIPKNIQSGVYTVAVIQETNAGICLNTCAQTESKPIRIK